MPKPSFCFVAPYIYGLLRPGESTDVGGAERQQHIIARQLRDEGFEVSFIAFRNGRDRYERIDNFAVWNVLPRSNDVIWTAPTFFILSRFLRKTGAEYVYTRGNPPLCILTGLSCRLLGKSHIYSLANDSNLNRGLLRQQHSLFKYQIFRKLYFNQLRSADLVISQTDRQQQKLANEFQIPSVVLPNVYNLPPSDQIVPPTDREYFLWVGSLRRNQKRPERFLETARKIPDEKFLMIGYTSDKEYQEFIEYEAKSIPNLEFEGFVPPDKIDQYYRYAKALINTSDYEGFPNTFLEAWRFGIPVVSLCFELADQPIDGQMGFVSGSMNNLIEDITHLSKNPDIAKEIARNCRTTFKENYTVANYTEPLIFQLEKLED